MRSLVVLVALGFIAIPVAAHDGEHSCDESNEQDAWTHLDVREHDFGNGSRVDWLLAWDGGCPLGEDWWVFVWFDAERPFRALVEHEGAGLREYFGPAGESVMHVWLPEAGFPQLTITGEGNVTAYFDQTCDCPAKTAPVPGPVWLNHEGAKMTWGLQFVPQQFGLHNEPAPTEYNVTISWGRPTTFGMDVWDTETRTFSTDDPTCGLEGALHRGCWTYEIDSAWDMQYLWVEVDYNATGWGIGILPAITVEKEAPGLASMAGALLLLCLAVLRRARQ